LALVHSALGDQTRALQAVLTLCNALTVVLSFLLGALLFRWRVGLLAAAVCALDPSMVYTAARLGREPMLALLSTAGVLCAFMAVRSERIAWALVAGAAFALLAYFKETGYVTCGILAAWMVALGWRRRLPLWKPALAMLACTLVLVLPWMARNTLLRHRTVTMSSIAPVTLSNGLGTSQIWASHQPDAIRTALDPWSSANPADAERRLLRRSLGYIEANPREAFATIAYNAALFWSPLGRYSLKSWSELSAAERFGLFYHGVLLSVSLLALWSLRRSPYAQGVALLLVVMTAMHSPFDAGPRYRVAFEPLLVVFFARIAATWARQASGMRRVKTTSERKKSLLAVVTHPTGPSHPPDKRDLVPPRRDP
jgi:4-amino-4-deoxy-L-arabinose transferase-like glycosyltransferase